jgi:hypothetical protein
VSGPAGGGEIFSSINSPTAEFSSPNTGVYTLRWTLLVVEAVPLLLMMQL